MKMRDFDNNELFNLQVCTGEKVSYFAASSFTNNYISGVYLKVE